MQKKFGAESVWVYDILRGIDNTPGKLMIAMSGASLIFGILSIVKERTATKSMLASKNITPIITTREAGYHWLAVLAGELYVRLRDAREITDGLWPKSLVLGTRQGG
jgi:DNA polymerase eta